METNIFEWICRIIDTCNNDFHFEAIDRLIALYFEREKDESKVIELETLKIRKWNEIHHILN